jgi:PAS domain S-box-containing protein
MITISDPDGRVIYANPATERVSGFAPEEFVGRNSFETIHPEDRPRCQEAFERLSSTPGLSLELEHRIRHKNGGWRWIEGTFVSLFDEPEVGGLLATVRDVTERSRAEEALRESEERFRLMADTVPIAVWITDPHGRAEFFNRWWTDYCGVPYEPTTAAEVAARFLHPEDAPKVMAAFEEARRTGATMEVEQRNLSSSGEYRWFLNRAEPYRDPETGEIVRWFGVGIDVHDRTLAEEALKESEERHRLIVEGARDYAIITTDPEGRIESWSPGAEAVYGWSAEEIFGKPVAITFTPEDREAGKPEKELAVASREGSAPDVRWHLRKDGSRVFIEGSTRIMRGGGEGGGPRGFVKVGQDVTERRALEEEGERLRAVEITARAEASERKRISRELHDRVAHTMAVVHQSLQLYEAYRERAPEAAERKLELAKQKAAEAMKDTRDLSQALRAAEGAGEGLALEEAFSELLSESVPPGITHEVSVEGDEGTVPDEVREQLYLVLREAVRNAVSHSQASKVSVEVRTDRERIVGVVEDDGRGFERKPRERTEAGGLAYMAERASLMGGTCSIESAPGEGTRVESSFPLENA